MMQLIVQSSSLSGSIRVTTSKSHTMRAVLLGSLAHGTTTVRHYLPSPDTVAMVAACKALGAGITQMDDVITIQGTGGNLTTPKQVIDVGNSGQVLRFVASIAALLPHHTVITGDNSICSIRPMNPLLGALQQLGAFALSTKGDGHAPIVIGGKAKAGHVCLDGQDSQPVSAMLFLAAFLEGETVIEVNNPGELPWINLTLHWLDMLGVTYTNDNYTKYTVQGPVSYQGFDYTVPGDWSSAAFPIAAALVTNSSITLENMDFADPQGDKAIIGAFQAMGASIIVDAANRRVEVKQHSGLHGATINVNDFIDAVPVLAAVACFASSPVIITGGGIARHKECDRIHAIAVELKKMGATIEEQPEGLIIHPSILHGAQVSSWHDHRIAMALSVAGCACGNVVIDNVACVAKSFPGFAAAMRGLGANIVEVEEA